MCSLVSLARGRFFVCEVIDKITLLLPLEKVARQQPQDLPPLLPPPTSGFSWGRQCEFEFDKCILSVGVEGAGHCQPLLFQVVMIILIVSALRLQ